MLLEVAMSENKKLRFSDALVAGFALFATFFGAGNLIFPPFLGNTAGDDWFIGFLCFILADAGLAVMTVLAMVRKDGTVWSMFDRLGRIPKYIVTVTAMTIVGPALCIPRTCATTFELSVTPLFPDFNPWLFALIFFALVFLLIVRPSRVVDIIGKYLTPVLLLSLAVLVIKGIATPLGELAPSAASAAAVSKEGFLAGYQTMDVLGALAFTMVVTGAVAQKGYTDHRSRFRVVAAAGLVAALGLFLVYGGLTYLGSTTSQLSLGEITQTGLVVSITQQLMGKAGIVLLAVIVLFACLTTALGLTASYCDFFHQLTKKRVPYALICGGVCAISVVISNVGISTMIRLATPLLNVLYPLLLTQIVLSFFDRKIKKDSVFRGAALGALVACVLSVAADHGAPTGFVHFLPLSSMGLHWILPAAAGALIGALFPKKRNAQERAAQ